MVQGWMLFGATSLFLLNNYYSLPFVPSLSSIRTRLGAQRNFSKVLVLFDFAVGSGTAVQNDELLLVEL